MNSKKWILITLIVLAGLTGLYFTIRPFLKTTLKLNIKSAGTYIIIDDNIEIDVTKPIPLRPGEHKVIAFKKDYRHLEQIITVKNFGETVFTIKMTQKLTPVPDSLPFEEVTENTGFTITGSYNDYLEPIYLVSYANNESLNKAKGWLNKNNFDLEKDLITFYEDGD